MTSRNLNRTWRDVIFAQYAADYDADVPFPVSYLIHATQWKRDIIIEIPSKVDVGTFRRSVADFFVAKHRTDPVYQDEHISVRPRISNFHGQNQDDIHEGQDDTAIQNDAFQCYSCS